VFVFVISGDRIPVISRMRFIFFYFTIALLYVCSSFFFFIYFCPLYLAFLLCFVSMSVLSNIYLCFVYMIGSLETHSAFLCEAIPYVEYWPHAEFRHSSEEGIGLQKGVSFFFFLFFPFNFLYFFQVFCDE